MGDDDVRLSAGERAAFDDIARRLAEDRGNRDRPHTRTRRLRGPTASWLLFGVGLGAFVSGLLTGNLWLGGAGLVTLVVALHRLTRRWNWARMLLWWRRTGSPPPPDEHMWEP